MAYPFHEVQLPKKLSYGSKGGPGFFTQLSQTTSGHEHAVSRWDLARHAYDLSHSVKSYADLTELKTFFVARGGAANGFRLSDPFDMNSNPTDSSFSGPGQGVADQRIGVGTGSTTTFQLKKTYESGLSSYERAIRKPVAGTIQIWINGALQSSGFSVDATTGVVTFTTAPANGATVDASFEFDVPVRFDEDADRALTAVASTHGSGDLQPVGAAELLDPSSAGTVTEFATGGANELSISANAVASSGLGRLWVVSATTTGLSLSMPDPTAYPTGGPILYVVNGGSNSFTVKDHSGTTLVTLSANQAAEILLSLTSGGQKVWYAI